MAMGDRLLAKSYGGAKYGSFPPDYALLRQHSRDVATACDALSLAVGRIALCNAGLTEEIFESFRLTLRANGWMQDLGKASSQFQEMVRGYSEIKQLLRHETISGLLLWREASLREWLAPLSEYLLPAIWGAMGHHRKFDEQTVPEHVSALTVRVSHPDFSTTLEDMSHDLNLSAPPRFEHDLIIARDRKDPCDLPALQSLRDLQDEFEEREAEFEDQGKRRMLALVKAFGIAADVAASAVAAHGMWARNYSLPDYVTETLTKIGLTVGDISRLINKWAWDRSDCAQSLRDESTLPPGFTIRQFQSDVAESASALTLAQAGCGSGKSLAAYLWAGKWCETLNVQGRTIFRLFFCLPTTGTTTEHFRDYALESGIDASLTHSRARVDLRAIAETASQEEAAEGETDAAKAAQAALSAERDKIESLALWSTPLVVTTADTVLGLMSNARRSIYSLPAIMSGAIVFDEIHAFDEQMFGHLLVFLTHFPRLPVLLMTASLPDERLQAIKNVRPDLAIVSGPPELEMLPRYLIVDSTGETELWRAVKDCLACNGKVLWVRNRVEWANQIYAECRRRFPQVYCNVYHSRFRYRDRSHRHRQVIDRFKQRHEAAILIATQVAEMSLDLSADLLVTDLAPIPSLIQRMGRLNRFATLTDSQSKPAIIRGLPEERNVELPYEKDEVKRAERWVQFLKDHDRPLSQRDLSQAFAKLSSVKEYDLAAAEQRACFFSGLWRTRPGQTRGEGYTVSVILEGDLSRCDDLDRNGEPKRDWLREYEVPILFKEAVLKWRRIGSLRVAPDSSVVYDFDEGTKEGTGARWVGT